MRFRGMWRWVGFFLNAMCIVVFAGLAALYIRQMFYWDYLGFGSEAGYIGLSAQSGQVILSLTNNYTGPTGISWEVLGGFRSMPIFRWVSWHVTREQVMIYIPIWMLMLVVAIKPTWSFVAWYRKGRRRIRGHTYCANCDYDLHGVTSRKCPECGALF